jgi:hypothetical protein
MLRQSNNDVETTIAFEQAAGVLAAHGHFHEVLHVGNVDSVAR